MSSNEVTQISADEIADIIEEGASWIKEHGWVKGQLFEDGSEHAREVIEEIEAGLKPPAACLMGGVYMGIYAHYPHFDSNNVQWLDMFRPYVPDHPCVHGQSCDSPTCYNDYPETEVWQILDLMQKTAKDIRVKGEGIEV